ncbi:MAG TPA: hypothetical protein DCR16_03185 [Lachnospiraceae bacterium]|nr:hypothetical protein [Lachnospiraceae bacterium]
MIYSISAARRKITEMFSFRTGRTARYFQTAFRFFVKTAKTSLYKEKFWRYTLLILPEHLFICRPSGQRNEEPMASITKFGEKIKLRREELGISQEQLGNLCGVSRRTIVSYETMGKFPRASTLSRLSRALGVTARYLSRDDLDDPQAGMEEEPFVQAAQEAFGRRAADEMAELLSRSQALFAGGSLSEDQKDLFFEAVSRAYFMNKQHAREKFGRSGRPADAADPEPDTSPSNKS